jgi:integrase
MATRLEKPLANGRWRIQVYLGRDATTGKPRLECKTFDRKKEAEAWARQVEGKRDEGTYRPTDPKLTLAEFLTATWLPVARTQVRSTYNLEKTLGKWVLRERKDTPFLGGMTLRKLTDNHFDRLYTAMAAQGMGTRGIAYLHGILRKALKFARKKKLLTLNPTDDATLPKTAVQAEITTEHDEEEGEVQYLNQEQAGRFLAVAKADRWSALWHLLLDAGLRPGEAFALQWRHVDFEQRLVKVRGTLTRIGVTKKNAGGKGWKIMPPKTKASIGEVPISATTIAELRRWKAQQAEERLKLGPEWQDHGFVFTTEFGSPLGNNLGRAWTRILAAADAGKGDLGTWGPDPVKPKSGPTPERTFTPRFVPYVLRHTCATLLLLDDMDLLSVSRRLRHKNITITARFYGHVQAKHTTKAADSFDRLAASVH